MDPTQTTPPGDQTVQTPPAPVTPPAPAPAPVTPPDDGMPKATTKEEWEIEKDQMAGKMSKLQREHNAATRGLPLETVNYMMDLAFTMDSLAGQSPEFKERVTDLIGKAQRGELTKAEEKELKAKSDQAAATVTTPPPVSDTPEAKWTRQRMKEESDREEKFLADLEGEDKADIDSRTFTDPKTGVRKNLTRQTIGTFAERLIHEQGLDREAAYKQAFLIVVHPEKLKEEGQLAGLTQSLTNGQSTGSIAGGKATGSSSLKVPEELRAGYEYRLANGGKERAEAFVRNASKKL